ncbi:S-adenosylmethionine/S-adenosylhomocysteine transporter [Chlamydiales bacterium STE3]|nr:S-adenosylmethionine/S-adenosylhomocysteine transporter [Chlamydiales bacterium STE3]
MIKAFVYTSSSKEDNNMFLVILVYALFASVFTTAKTALDYTEPLFLVGSRMLFAGALLLGYQYLFHRKHFILRKKDLLRLTLLALFAIYLTNAFEFWGLKYLTSFKTCFIYSLSPFTSALLSYFVFGERMTSKKWLGLITGFAGFIPILLSQTASEETTGHFLFLSWAEISVIMAALCSVYGWILLKQLVSENHLSPIMANGMSMFIGGSIALIHSFFVESWTPVPVTEFAPFLTCTLVLILVSNFICYNLYGWLLKHYSATFMSFAGFTTPLFAAFFGWLYLGETITWPFYLSAGIVFLGLTLFNQEELKSETLEAVRT